MVIMTNRLADDVDVLLIHLQQTLEFTNNLKQKCKRAEEERDSAVAELAEFKNKYEHLRVKSLTKSSCEECGVLKEQLIQQRRLAKESQARLKSVASLLNFDDASQRNQLTEAQCVLVSQMLVVPDEGNSFSDHNDSGGARSNNSSNEMRGRRQSFSLLSGKPPIEDGPDPNILVPETVPYEVSEDIKHFRCGVTIPETQAEEENVFKNTNSYENNEEGEGSNMQEQENNTDESTQFKKKVNNRAEQIRAARFNRSIYKSTEDLDMTKNEITQVQMQSNTTRQPDDNKDIDNKETMENRVLKSISPENKLSLKSRSVSQKRDSDDNLKENIDSSSGSSDSSLCLQVDHKYSRVSNDKERTAPVWKLKASNSIEHGVASGEDAQRKKKKLTQTKLTIASFNRRHDVSSFENFNGGVASTSVIEEDENDIILPSPNKNRHKKFRKQQIVKESRTEGLDDTPCSSSLINGSKPLSEDSSYDRIAVMTDIRTQDLDETLFNPAVTSTCKPAPAESSFDRIPEVSKSPPYKYRRNAVRKKDERMKLPGQQCNDCAKFFEATGYSKEDRQKVMNACSRHRDKYPILYNSPPEFWDPVIPESPE